MALYSAPRSPLISDRGRVLIDQFIFPGGGRRQLSQDAKDLRRDEIIAAQQKICRAFARARVGQVVDVLVDGMDEDGSFFGRTSLEAPETDPVVFLTDPEDGESLLPQLEIGQFRKCLITDTIGPGDMVAHPVA